MEAISRHAGSVALLVGLLLVFFALISYQVNRSETVSVVEGTVLTVVSPVHRMLAVGWLGLVHTWQGYVGLVGTAEEVVALRTRLAALERQVDTLQEASRENARLRSLLHLQADLDLPSLSAETIGRDVAHAFETITVSRGGRDGVPRDAPVLAANGALVGRVIHVAPWTSMVQLITDSQSAVGARVARSRASGVIHGQGRSLLQLAYVHSLSDVQPHDLVVTSGEDGLYPAGIPIGRVHHVKPGSPVPGTPPVPLNREETALFLDVSVAPLVDVRRVEQVLLLLPPSHPE